MNENKPKCELCKGTGLDEKGNGLSDTPYVCRRCNGTGKPTKSIMEKENPKPYSLADFQQQVAEKYGYKELYPNQLLNEAAEAYASYRYAQGKEEGVQEENSRLWNEGYAMTQEESYQVAERKGWNEALHWAAEHATVDYCDADVNGEYEDDEATVNKQSILNGLKQEED